MINIILRIFENDLAVEAEGHALFDKRGRDIVCSSVSILLESWYLSEKELCEADIKLLKNSGFFKAELFEFDEKEKLLFDSLVLSLLVLENQYKENIKVSVEDDNGKREYGQKRKRQSFEKAGDKEV